MRGCADSLLKIQSRLQHPAARTDEQILVTENAAAALGRILACQAEHVPAAQLWPAWLAFMPILTDDEEAPRMAQLLIMQIRAYGLSVVPVR